MEGSFQQSQFHSIVSLDFYNQDELQKRIQISEISPICKSTSFKNSPNSPGLKYFRIRDNSEVEFKNLINEITMDPNTNGSNERQAYQNTFQIFKKKERLTIEKEQMKFIAQSRWISQDEIKCMIQHNNNSFETVCKISKGQIQFNNGSIKISLINIIKIKISYLNYNKCIILTYLQSLNKKPAEMKCKISIQSDIKDDLYLLLAKIIIEKLNTLKIQVKQDEISNENANKVSISGQLYKKSQILGNWSLRKVVITDMIQSYKDDKCTYSIKNIKQIWSRFQIYEEGLIIKIRHGSQKTEIAIPICNYSLRYSKNNWLPHLYRLIINPFT